MNIPNDNMFRRACALASMVELIRDASAANPGAITYDEERIAQSAWLMADKMLEHEFPIRFTGKPEANPTNETAGT